MWFYMIFMNFWLFFKIWWILCIFVQFFLVVMLGLLGVNTGEFCLFFWCLLQFRWFGVYGVCFARFIFFLILMCIIGVSVFVDFFIKICIILVFFWCLSYFLIIIGTYSTSCVFYCGVLFCCNVRILWWYDKVFVFFVGNQYC